MDWGVALPKNSEIASGMCVLLTPAVGIPASGSRMGPGGSSFSASDSGAGPQEIDSKAGDSEAGLIPDHFP